MWGQFHFLNGSIDASAISYAARIARRLHPVSVTVGGSGIEWGSRQRIGSHGSLWVGRLLAAQDGAVRVRYFTGPSASPYTERVHEKRRGGSERTARLGVDGGVGSMLLRLKRVRRWRGCTCNGYACSPDESVGIRA
jgi:hypothetical protein